MIVLSLFVSCIQPTYEELKPMFCTSTINSVPCIQPTYEELKPWCVPRFIFRLIMYPAYIWGIETVKAQKKQKKRKKNTAYINSFYSIHPSYDVMKLAYFYYCLSHSIRIQPTYEELKPILPNQIENWKIWYPAYLWGIETNSSLIKVIQWHRYPAYLWGIETKKKKKKEKRRKR